MRITLAVNGTEHVVECEDGELLVEVLRERLRLTGTHVGCLNGDCGACTIELDGHAIKSCLKLAAACDGSEITTIEGLAGDGELDPIQESFWAQDGFQCGFCLPGQLFATRELLDREDAPSEGQIRHALAGNLCRCTGYVKMVTAVQAAAQARRV
jgi:carbon-monoxide dehydrogenase small subunit